MPAAKRAIAAAPARCYDTRTYHEALFDKSAMRDTPCRVPPRRALIFQRAIDIIVAMTCYADAADATAAAAAELRRCYAA